MSKIKNSLESKKQDLQAAIDKAEALINDPNTSADDAKKAMKTVAKLQADIDYLTKLLDTESAANSESASDSSSEALSDSTTESESDSLSDSSELGSDSLTPEPETGSETIENDQEEERSMPIKVSKTLDTQKTNDAEKRALNDYLHSRGEKRDGLKSTDVGVLIPIDIIYNPETEVKTVYDLASLVTKQAVKTVSGKYPILKKPSATLPSTEELEKNPDLAKPEFTDVEWRVETYRGAIPISQESLDDTEIDLSSMIADYIQQIKLNTTNAKIAAKMNTFQTAAVAQATLVDDLKKIINVNLDVAYNKSFTMTQSAYNLLDTIKDTTGNYLLQKSITIGSNKTLLGLPVTVVEDTAFGGALGATQIWVGDLKRAFLYADRADVAVAWVWNEIYGKYLSAVIRFDVEVADAKAGYFVDLNATTGGGSDGGNSGGSETAPEA